jgi:dienelactone hydrolase
MSRRVLLLVILIARPARADDATDALAKELRDYATAELAKVPGKDGKYSTALADYLRKRIQRANQADREEWNKVKSRADWEKFRDERINALRDSLGTWPEVPKTIPTRITKTIEAEGYAIENLLYQSRPDVWVTGNLYRPNPKRERMPVILIVHSHHAPKEQGELQDMGVTWAKLGCMVLVIDQLGHGERRQHPFATAKDYPKEFRVGRQDYYFRYNLNLQLSLVGDSLMGWMVWDLMRGLDVVLARPGVDKERVILLGAVAGGGDPAAVTAALDPRIQCVVPFNFGGPQPETRYPLPEDAETSFNYAGSGSWESTRNLRDSAHRGFLPWVIVASAAPRKVIHAHEFSWDRERDPVWKRYQKVWGFYEATDNVSFTHGSGVIQGNDPTASHCTNIGPIHRKGIYAAMKKWFDIQVPDAESKERRTAEELRCWTPGLLKELKPKPLHEVLGNIADKQSMDRQKLLSKIPAESRDDGIIECFGYRVDRTGHAHVGEDSIMKLCRAHWMKSGLSLGENDGRYFPGSRALVLIPGQLPKGTKVPTVCCICQNGVHTFVRERASAIATLLNSGVGVQIVDLHGTGVERPSDGRGRSSGAATLASTIRMTGLDLLRVHWAEAEIIIGYLINVPELDPDKIVLWGESCSPPADPAREFGLPADLPQPLLGEPLGATIVTTLGLAADPFKSFKAVIARGGLVSFRSVLDSPFVHIPHDSLPTDVFSAGDLPDMWAHLAPKPLRLEGLVDGTNRRVTGEKLAKALQPVTEAYKKGGLVVNEDYTPDAELAKWIVEQLKK